MANKHVKRGMAELAQAIEQAIQQASALEQGRASARRINITRRSNIVVKANVGQPGAVERASATQHTSTRQAPGAAAEATTYTEGGKKEVQDD